MNKKENKNLLPPFLMIRSGLLNDFVLAAALTAGTGIVESTLSSQQDVGFPTLLMAIVTCLFAAIRTSAKYDYMRQDIAYVIEQMRDLKDDNGDVRLSMSHFPRLAQIMVRYISKKDPVYFNKMVNDPHSIQNDIVERDIAIGHLRAHPKDAYLLQNTNVNIDMLPRNLYRKIMRANNSK
jgi:hypothetical protein